MAGSPTLLPESRLGSTLRRDRWWIEIIPIFLVMGGFSIYATLRAFEGAYYSWGVPTFRPFTLRSLTRSITGGHSHPLS